MSYQLLNAISNDLIKEISTFKYVRSNLFSDLEPSSQIAIILKGARGIGKSTVLLQFLHQKQKFGHKVLYLSADSSVISHSLTELAFELNKSGVSYLAIDEIHKYADWQREVKTILDSFPKLKLIVSGSSSLHLNYKVADLSRRHIMLRAKGLSFREYLEKNYSLNLKKYSLIEILENTDSIVNEVINELQDKKINVIEIFHIYLREGYFITRDNFNRIGLYYDSLINSINSTIEVDLPSVYTELDGQSIYNIKSMLKHIARKCPFTPNIQEISSALGIAKDNTLKKYLQYLNDGEIILNLYHVGKFHKNFLKPQKIFLNNPNYAYALFDTPDIGTIRETFVANCLVNYGDLTAPAQGDFCLNDKWTFEVGGRSKTKKQLKGIKDSFVLADNTLLPNRSTIPLWVLGFLW
jgi:predicted AAA+ superfamily ATPase